MMLSSSLWRGCHPRLSTRETGVHLRAVASGAGQGAGREASAVIVVRGGVVVS